MPPHAWVLIDLDGHVERASRGACELLGVDVAAGDDLLRLLPVSRRSLLFDIEVAMTGWPVERTFPISHT